MLQCHGFALVFVMRFLAGKNCLATSRFYLEATVLQDGKPFIILCMDNRTLWNLECLLSD
jgi:hypothetical protein